MHLRWIGHYFGLRRSLVSLLSMAILVGMGERMVECQILNGQVGQAHKLGALTKIQIR